jgi:hypothetical protein
MVTDVIDALELRIPPDARFRPQWRELRKSIDKVAVGMTSGEYRRCDLRSFGLSAVFHSSYSQRRQYDKLAFSNTASMLYSDMEAILKELMESDWLLLQVARIDFALDLVNVPVDWFYRHTFAYKRRFSREFGTYSKSGVLRVETVYIGKRPNCYRIYDRLAKSGSPGNPSTDGTRWLTRIERECGGAGIPSCVSSFGQLRNAAEFDPFVALRAIFLPRPATARKRKTVIQLLALRGLESLISEWGMQQTIRFLNWQSSGNAARIRRSLGLTEGHITQTFSGEFARYQAAIRRQLQV